MNEKRMRSGVTPILPVELGSGKILYAQGIKAGRWVFATGQMGQNFKSGICPDVIAADSPHTGLPKREKEAELIFDHIEKVLKTAGTNLSNSVLTDQYYTSVDVVPHYQKVRRERFGKLIPPSTSITEKRFVLPDADLNIQLIAVIPEDGFDPVHLQNSLLEGRPTSGYSPALTVGDYVFVPGMTASGRGDEPCRNGLAEAARIKEGMQWGGKPIKLETEFIIAKRIIPSLELANSSLKDVVKAQVYLTDPEDYSSFNEAWTRHFDNDGPALSIIPCANRGLAVADGKIEINIVALKSNGGTKKEQIDAGVFAGFDRQSQAVRAGDLLFISGLMAVDQSGLIPEAKIDTGQPWYSSSVEAQVEFILEQATIICEKAGTTLSNTVRSQFFHTDIEDFYSAYKVWERRSGRLPLPFAAIEVPHALPVPGASVLIDFWVYVP